MNRAATRRESALEVKLKHKLNTAAAVQIVRIPERFIGQRTILTERQGEVVVSPTWIERLQRVVQEVIRGAKGRY